MNFEDVTFVILTKNEAARIGDCLAALPPKAHAIVYDAQSADNTADLAAALGARVISAPWVGFVQARAKAARMVTTPWTFMLDADERLSQALQEELRALAPSSEIVAYAAPRRNYFGGKWIRGAGWWPDRLVRLFRTGRARVVARPGSEGAQLHEVWVPDGARGALASPIDHYSYASVRDYRAKFARYTALEAQAAIPSLLRTAGALATVPWRFAWLSIVRRGIFDGPLGIYVSAASAAYPAAVELKAWRRSH